VGSVGLKGRATVSEESSTDAPGTTASGDELAPGPEAPPRRSRRALLILSCAAAASAALIAVALVWSLAYGPTGPRFSHLPKPCTLISLATLDAYLPGATATPLSISAGVGQSGFCRWTSTSGGQTTSAFAEVVILGRSSAITSAQQFYATAVSSLGCHCRGVTATTRTVAGLGDQAAVVFITARPDANLRTAPNSGSAGTCLIVRSSNAVIILNYTAMATATGTLLPPGTHAAQVTFLTSMARDILAGLARPAASPAPGLAAPISPEPHYAGHRDPCRLITAATLARYLPGSTVGPLGNPAASPSAPSQMSSCGWASSTSTGILLNLNVFRDASSAFQQFTADTQGSGQSGAGTTVTGTQVLPGLGETAFAVFQTQNGAHLAELFVWSGNAELQFSYYGPGGRPPDRATLLTGGIAMARDALAALANPAASAYLQEPVYASPHDPCTLIRPATVATYLPGSTASPTTDNNPLSQLNSCSWTGVNGSLSLFATIYPDPDSALGGFQADLQQSQQKQSGITYDGSEPVRDLGQQATAVFETSVGSPEVNLYILAGNAEIDLDFFDAPFSGPQPGRAAVLAAGIVMAREVLADLPH
jgi:hypothetical protein